MRRIYPARLEIPEIPENQQTSNERKMLALIDWFCSVCSSQREKLQAAHDQIAILKGLKPLPTFTSSKMHERATATKETETDPAGDSAQAGQDANPQQKKPRKSSSKPGKTAELTIHAEQIIQPDFVPAGARFKGYRDFVVQDLQIAAYNTRYRLAVWQTADGQHLVGALPAALDGRHFGPILQSYLLYQHHHCQVTQPLLLEQLREWGIEMSSGQINALLTARASDFIAEADALLVTGLATSTYITVDDTGARHQGCNGYVTHMGNDHFAWFGGSANKSRIQFLTLLHAGSVRYQMNEEALHYLQAQGLPQAERLRLQQVDLALIDDPVQWEALLRQLEIQTERHQRIATEGALLGGLLAKGFNPDLAIISDGAGQFNVLLHGLCWIHAERLIQKLIPCNTLQSEAIQRVQDQIWQLYADLKAYQQQPDADLKAACEARFDAIFSQHTQYATLDALLKRTQAHKPGLLLVLERPDVPLHTNGSETAIRDLVKKRKVSGGTRSELGRRCRNAFAGLKITARKLGISFWAYLVDRIERKQEIAPLPGLLREHTRPMHPATG